jgi:hypothetical protein
MFEWVEDLPTAYSEGCRCRASPAHACGDHATTTAAYFITPKQHMASRNKYIHLLCYGTFHATPDTALETFMDSIRLETYTSQKEADSWGLFDPTMRTHMACCNTNGELLTLLRRFKCKNSLNGEEQIAERLVHSIFLGTQA